MLRILVGTRPLNGSDFAYKRVVGSNSPPRICSGGSATYVVDVILSPGVLSGLFDKNHGKCLIFPSLRLSVTYVLDVLWGQPIKLIQVVSTSEFHEY